MKNILLIESNSAIGGNLAGILLEKGNSVYGMSRSMSMSENEKHKFLITMKNRNHHRKLWQTEGICSSR